MIEIKSVAQIHTYSDNQCMGVVFHWTTEKNHQLVEQRGVSFESVVSAIEQGGLLGCTGASEPRPLPGAEYLRCGDSRIRSLGSVRHTGRRPSFPQDDYPQSEGNQRLF